MTSRREQSSSQSHQTCQPEHICQCCCPYGWAIKWAVMPVHIHTHPFSPPSIALSKVQVWGNHKRIVHLSFDHSTEGSSILFTTTNNLETPSVLASCACSRVWPPLSKPVSNSPILAAITCLWKTEKKIWICTQKIICCKKKAYFLLPVRILLSQK